MVSHKGNHAPPKMMSIPQLPVGVSSYQWVLANVKMSLTTQSTAARAACMTLRETMKHGINWSLSKSTSSFPEGSMWLA